MAETKRLEPIQTKKPPLICKIRKWVYQSPSAMFRCSWGIRHHIKECERCEKNISIMMHNGFCKGFNSVLKAKERNADNG